MGLEIEVTEGLLDGNLELKILLVFQSTRRKIDDLLKEDVTYHTSLKRLFSKTASHVSRTSLGSSSSIIY